jgi:membrane protein YdbS with pleckstrin-like domain
VIQISCDNCEKRFQVDAELAGQKAACPYCGDINRIPEERTPESRGLPPEQGPEREITTVRPALFRAHPFRALLIFFLFAGGIALAIWSNRGDQTWLMYLSLVPTAVGLVWAIYWIIKAHLWIRLTISNKRTVQHEGIITRRTSEVLHDHVRNVEIEQSFLQRILGTGSIGISSAGQDDIEIMVKDIPNPYAVKKLIDEYRDM